MSKKTILIIVLIILGALILASGSYAGYRLWKHNKELKEQEKISAENDESIETDEEQISAESEQETETNDQTVNSGWLEYKNYLNKYLIEYPNEAKISDISDPAVLDINYSNCLKISTENYYVLIGTAPGENDPATCFRTGVGADWGQGPTETLTAAGMEYTTTGMHTEAASAGYYQDFLMISPVDGRVKIEYGIDVNEKYGTISKIDAKEIVHKIIASYSPAE
ncbi:MAG TPA: hypothetical protein PLH82_02715 [Candidatus Paceibacterota bacterium]|nr:hypothetical protein [Candidatus Paceibacterota bacterium]